MLTSFLVYDDPKVSVAVVRDADSRLSPRELFAVNEWISSDFRFHVMRDHASHDVAVLGGMFGMKRGALRDASMSHLIHASFDRKPNPHQGRSRRRSSFLTRYVWPKVKHSCFAHDVDAKRCSKFGSKRCETFLWERETNRRNSTSVRRSRARVTLAHLRVRTRARLRAPWMDKLSHASHKA